MVVVQPCISSIHPSIHPAQLHPSHTTTTTKLPPSPPTPNTKHQTLTPTPPLQLPVRLYNPTPTSYIVVAATLSSSIHPRRHDCVDSTTRRQEERRERPDEMAPGMGIKTPVPRTRTGTEPQPPQPPPHPPSPPPP